MNPNAVLRAKLCFAYTQKKGSIEQFLSGLPLEFEPIKANREKLLRWNKLYMTAVKKGEDVCLALYDKRGRPEGSDKLTDEQKSLIVRYLLRSDIRATNAGIYKNFRQKWGEIVSYETVNRYIESYKKNNLFTYDFATNPDKAKGKHKPATGNASEEATHVCAMWELDGTPADVITNDGQRWAVIACIDVHTRRVVVTLEKKTSAFAVARNLREAILRWGLPELVVTDNGRDYTSNHFDEVLLRLGIAKREVPPYSGECKPHIERFFGTLARGLFREVEGFCGHDVAERQAIRGRKTFEQKLLSQAKWREKFKNGDALAQAFAKKKENDGLPIELPLSPAELWAAICNWLEHEYENSIHGTIKMTPVQMWNSCPVKPRRIKDARLLDLLLGQSRMVTVSKKGILFKEDGIDYQYAAVKLVGLVSQKVKIILPDEMSMAVVYDGDTGAYICTAHDAAHYGGSREMAKVLAGTWRKKQSAALKASKEADRLAALLQDPTAYTRTTPDAFVREEKRVAYTPVVDSTSSLPTGRTAKALEHHPVEEPFGENGRPFFDQLIDRFVWAMMHDDWNEKDEALALKNEILREQAINAVRKTG